MSYTIDNFLPALDALNRNSNSQSTQNPTQDITQSNESDLQFISLQSLATKDKDLCFFLINNLRLILPQLKQYKLIDNLTITELKEISTSLMNKFVSFNGRVTRTSAIYPEMMTCQFVCGVCKSITDEMCAKSAFKCPNHLCSNRNNFKVQPITFRDYQMVHVQEIQTQDGHLPRSIEVKCYNENTEMVRPGEIVLFNGCIQIERITNKRLFKSAKQIVDEQLKIIFLCHSINKKKIDTLEISNIISKVIPIPDLYNVMSNLLFPSIYGHKNIKNSILLQLIGGCSTKRKNINILLLGDPGTAKSQFLKQISSQNVSSADSSQNNLINNQNIIYTTGKTSSGVGLTAAVVKSDNESIVEAGALVLSDQGICCIDEFDKLTVQDITSLHEAMEQQTVTINKSGINVTLNARASVLAAANPRNGRYDQSKSLRFNTNLSDTIMSRFDLFYVIVDEPDEVTDKKVAQRVIHNHLNKIQDPEMTQNILSKEEILSYINHVKTHVPKILPESKELLIKRYKQLRLRNTTNSKNYLVSVRTLESMIRLGEALAKLYQSDVLPEYIEEAYRLITGSMIEIRFSDIKINQKTMNKADIDKILNTFVYILKTKERLTEDDLILYYVESVVEKLSDESQLIAEQAVAKDVLQYLKDEGFLYENEGYIYVHPDYDS